jgi:hypothetical protein
LVVTTARAMEFRALMPSDRLLSRQYVVVLQT